jgi:hypothetical protein
VEIALRDQEGRMIGAERGSNPRRKKKHLQSEIELKALL